MKINGSTEATFHVMINAGINLGTWVIFCFCSSAHKFKRITKQTERKTSTAFNLICLPFLSLQQYLNFNNEYVPKGTTYYDKTIRIDKNPIKTALNVCKHLISKRVSNKFSAHTCSQLFLFAVPTIK